jgi:hypothetical protein
MIRTRVLGPVTLVGVIGLTLPFSAFGQQEPAPDSAVPPSASHAPAVSSQQEPPPAAPSPVLPEGQGEPQAPLLPNGNNAPIERGPLSEPPPAFPGPFSNLMGASVGHLVPRVDYRVTWFPDEEVRGQPTVLGYVQQDFSLLVPVWQCASDELSASASLRDEHFHTGAILPNSMVPFPEDLWNIRFGTSYRHLFDNGWIAGGSLSLGTASDKPFHSINEMTLGTNVFLRVPQGEHNAWLFTLSYSPVSELPFPIPGVAFLYQPTDYLRINIGLPFAVMYQPLDDLTLELSYMLLRTVHARAICRVYRNVRVYAGFDWSNESYFLADRIDENNRFFYYDKRLSGGVQTFFGRQAMLDISGGYVFDRFYFQGHQYNDKNYDRINVGSGPLLGLRFELRF